MSVKICAKCIYTTININIILLRKDNKKKTRGKKTVCSNFGVLRAAVFEPETLEFPAYIFNFI